MLWGLLILVCWSWGSLHNNWGYIWSDQFVVVLEEAPSTYGLAHGIHAHGASVFGQVQCRSS